MLSPQTHNKHQRGTWVNKVHIPRPGLLSRVPGPLDVLRGHMAAICAGPGMSEHRGRVRFGAASEGRRDRQTADCSYELTLTEPADTHRHREPRSLLQTIKLCTFPRRTIRLLIGRDVSGSALLEKYELRGLTFSMSRCAVVHSARGVTHQWNITSRSHSSAELLRGGNTLFTFSSWKMNHLLDTGGFSDTRETFEGHVAANARQSYRKRGAAAD